MSCPKGGQPKIEEPAIVASARSRHQPGQADHSANPTAKRAPAIRDPAPQRGSIMGRTPQCAVLVLPLDGDGQGLGDIMNAWLIGHRCHRSFLSYVTTDPSALANSPTVAHWLLMHQMI